MRIAYHIVGRFSANYAEDADDGHDSDGGDDPSTGAVYRDEFDDQASVGDEGGARGPLPAGVVGPMKSMGAGLDAFLDGSEGDDAHDEQGDDDGESVGEGGGEGEGEEFRSFEADADPETWDTEQVVEFLSNVAGLPQYAVRCVALLAGMLSSA